MQFLTIRRRGGEEIPINPLQVCYVRQMGAVTIVAMANGHEHRIQVPAVELVDRIEAAADASPSSSRAMVQEPSTPPGTEQAPPGPADGAPAAEADPEDEEEARKQAAGSRKQEADGEHVNDGVHTRGGVKK
jgi:hypothetical protein